MRSGIIGFHKLWIRDLKSKSKKKILTLATKNSHTLHREIDDNAVVNWKFDLFMEFVNILTSKEVVNPKRVEQDYY